MNHSHTPSPRTITRRATLGLVSAGAALATLIAATPTAHAQTAGKKQLAGAHAPCVLRGIATMTAGTPIYSARKDGKSVARFTGAKSAVAAFSFPKDADARASVRTGRGKGSFRIAGYIDVDALPVFVDEATTVVSRHVWINQDRRVRVLGRGGLGLRIQKRTTAPIDQTFTTTAPCDALALSGKPSKLPHVVPNALGYVAKGKQVDVFARAGAGQKPVIQLKRGGLGILFWSQEKRTDFVKVQHVSDVIVEGWVRRTDLQALPRGEIFDQTGLSKARTEPRTRIVEKPGLPSVMVKKEVPLRNAPSTRSPVIGRIEVNTKTVVVSKVKGWTRVLPADTHVAPPIGKGFWVSTKKLARATGRTTQ